MRSLSNFLLAIISLSTAKPIDPRTSLQRVLQHSQPENSDRLPSHRNAHFDAAPNSVGLLLTSVADQVEDVTHVWLPLGKRVETTDSPVLPLHPTTARITTLIRSSPELATPERLNEIECTVHLHVNETSAAEESRWQAKFGRHKKAKKEQVVFRRGDGLVWLKGAEVEAYECR